MVYYQQVSPIIKNFFNENTDKILDNLNAESNSKNHHILFAVEETLMDSIKQSIFSDHEELDELIEE